MRRTWPERLVSTTDSKLEQHRDTEGPARRTYASLEAARGFRADVARNSFDVAISTCPMDVRAYWRHVGSGKWNAAGALYEEVKP
jgi:hypothetical protein